MWLVPNGAILFIRPAFSLSTTQVELVVSAVLIGATIGAIASARLTDTLGRRLVLLAAALSVAVGAIGSALAPNAAALVAARVLVGLAIASDGRSELCAATLELFGSILGAESGDLALEVLSTGGVFVGGGIPPRMLPLLGQGGFMRALLPVPVILGPAAFMGAAQFGLSSSAHDQSP